MGAHIGRHTATQVAEMLRAGHTYSQINAATGVSRTTIAKIRKGYEIPSPAPGAGWDEARSKATIREKWECHVVDRPGGHQHWHGVYSNGMPLLCLSDRNLSARRLSFEFTHGRPADGPVTVDCDDPHCVAGAHMVDRPLRAKLRALYAAVAGSST